MCEEGWRSSTDMQNTGFPLSGLSVFLGSLVQTLFIGGAVCEGRGFGLACRIEAMCAVRLRHVMTSQSQSRTKDNAFCLHSELENNLTWFCNMVPIFIYHIYILPSRTHEVAHYIPHISTIIIQNIKKTKQNKIPIIKYKSPTPGQQHQMESKKVRLHQPMKNQQRWSTAGL